MIVKSMVLVCPLMTVLVVIAALGPTGAEYVVVVGTDLAAGAELEVRTPDISPVYLFIDNPSGRPRALYEVGLFRATIAYVNGTPTFADADS